jgi:hypothetical protein
MPQYVISQDAQSKADDASADAAFTEGSDAGATADRYIRDTVFLATVLFLVGSAATSGCATHAYRHRRTDPDLRVMQLLGLPAPPA